MLFPSEPDEMQRDSLWGRLKGIVGNVFLSHDFQTLQIFENQWLDRALYQLCRQKVFHQSAYRALAN